MKALCLFLFAAMIATGCKKTSEGTPTGSITVTGKLEVQGITTYQYGTHTIKNIDQFYTLKSSVIKLDDYAGKSVTITGNKVNGYPIEGGPELLDVVSIKVQ